MFGNTKGWISSAAIVVAMALFAWQLRLFTIPAPSAPTGKFPQTLKPLVLPVDPATIVPMNEPCDAADLYRQAIDAYKADRALYDGYDATKSDLTKMTALEALVKATPCSKMTLFSAKPESVIVYSVDLPDMRALDKLGSLALKVGADTMAKDADKGRRYCEAAFALGAKLFAERVIFDEANNGLNQMIASSAGLKLAAAKAKDTARVEQITRFVEETIEFKDKQFLPLRPVIASLDNKTYARYSGDIFQMAERSPERMWRVEALLTIGRMKFDLPQGHKGDRIAAIRRPKEWLNDPDPAVRRAAKLADDLTITGFRTISTVTAE